MKYPIEPFHGRFAQNIPVSYSEISMFKECRRKWWLTYYRGLSSKKVDHMGPLPLGTRVHKALEDYYTTGEDPVAAYSKLLDYDKLMFLSSDVGEDEKAQKTFDSEAELGRLMLEGYMQWLEETDADSRYDVISCEQEVAVPLLDGKFRVRGKVDMKVADRIDGSILVVDNKTARSITDYNTIAQNPEQLMLYTLLERVSSPGLARVEGGMYNILKKVKRGPTAKPPFYHRITVRFNDDFLTSYWTRLHGTLRDMMRVRDELDAGADHRYVAYPTPTKDCSWKCPFFAGCSLFDDGSAAESWVFSACDIKNPYERYGENEDEGV